MATDMAALVADLADESADLDRMLASLNDGQWRLATPAAGWTIADQVSHLAYFDDAALTAATDPDRFRDELAELAADGVDIPDRIAARYRDVSGPDLLAWLRLSRATLLDAFGSMEPGTRLPWYGPDMSAASSVTARIMETWAHGQDVADALERVRPATNRLRHIAHLGVRTVGFSFAINGRDVPADPIRVELTGPDGDAWSWGPADAANVVRGPVLDFCLVVTQRRHRDDTALVATGPVAVEWITIAQVFAGPPGSGRAPIAG
ncbi:MAG TPA: TIGR03084 family metal-binding protein [Micromonosporaceae bacterium]|jgi:uncharacterized protein (TIGR03084 family)